MPTAVQMLMSCLSSAAPHGAPLRELGGVARMARIARSVARTEPAPRPSFAAARSAARTEPMPPALTERPDPRRDRPTEPSPPPEAAVAVVLFWVEAGPTLWFAQDAAFDARFRAAFFDLHDAAARGDLTSWRTTTLGALALLLLLDQFPRNAFRGGRRMYATDVLARVEADLAITAGHDLAVEPALRTFFYLPFAHSEDLADQARCVRLTRERLGGHDAERAEHLRDIVRRFGRFPHRNAILGRPTREEEQEYLEGGGCPG